jgi:hypothetical protein
MGDSTRLDNVSSEDQEILATQWLTIDQLEEAGELNRLCTGTMFHHV